MAADQPRVFISYARADDEPFVERLHRDLEAAGIAVWWDRDTMASRGRTFLQEIRDAIEAVDRVIALIGPKAINSDYVRYEWEHAALFAKGILPILRLGDYGLVPSELVPEDDQGLAISDFGRLHCPDFRPERPYNEALNELVAIIQQPMPSLASYDGTPPLPPHFLPRRDDLRRLAQSVLADVLRPTVITSAKQTAALQGMGGIGKSVLAAAFGRAISTRRAMKDGIIWLSAGKDTTRLTLLANIKAVGTAFGDAEAHFLDEVSARKRLPDVLADKVCLIILDDVWSMEQVEPFRNALGPRCRLLVTTRDGTLVTAVGAEEHRVDVLSEEQALALLGEWSGQVPLAEGARQVADECGNLPLALALCGAMARDGHRWLDLLKALRKAKLKYIEHDLANFPFRDVASTFDVSVHMLGREDPSAVGRYYDLAVFPSEAAVPEAAVLTLWCRDKAFSELDARKLLRTLARKAMLTPKSGSPHGRVSFHDLQHDYLRGVAGDGIAALHNTLIDAYRSKRTGGWASVPDDGYYFQRLPWHLLKAGQAEALRALLFDASWLQRKLEVTGVEALLADYGLLSNEDSEAQQLAAALQMSAHVLARDPRQLAGQLCGRLDGSDATAITDLRAAVREIAESPALVPLHPTFNRPRTGEIRRFAGHTDRVTAVAILPDGRRALSSSYDKTFRLWDLESGEEIRRFAGHTDRVTAVAILPDGRHALSSSYDKTLRLWDLESGEEIRRFKGHADRVTAVAILPDGRHTLSSSYDETLRLWDLESGEEIRRFKGHTDTEEVITVAVLPDGRRALSISLNEYGSFVDWDFPVEIEVDYTLLLWNLESGEEIHRWHLGSERSEEMVRTDQVTAVAVLPDGRHALTAFLDHRGDAPLCLLDLNSDKRICCFRGHTRQVTAIAVLPDGRRALSGSLDDTFCLWDLKSGKEIRRWEGHTGRVTAVAVLRDGRRALSGSDDGTLRLWDLESGKKIRRLKGQTDRVTAVAALPNRQRALSGYPDAKGTLRLWNLENGKEVRCWKCHKGSVTTVAALPDGRHAISGSFDCTIRLWDLESGKEIRRFEGCSGAVSVVAPVPDGRRVVSGHFGGILCLWDLETGREIRRWEGHTNQVTAIAIPPNGRCVLSGSLWDEILRLWDLESGEEIHCFEGHTNDVTAVAVLPNGRRALSGSADKTLRLWDLESGKKIRRFKDHADVVTAVAVLPDGRRALSGSLDATIRLWNLQSGREDARLNLDSPVSCCAVTSSGTCAIVGDARGVLHVIEILL